jgi:nitrate reductase gamma subunit
MTGNFHLSYMLICLMHFSFVLKSSVFMCDKWHLIKSLSQAMAYLCGDMVSSPVKMNFLQGKSLP